MGFVSLYRRFRPDSFDKVIGQNHIVKTLSNQIKNDRVGHAYLFTGTRGTGKTSCAKIFAKAVNCLSPVNGSPCNKCEVCVELAKPSNIDIIEIDAASNNGVDEIRQLKENTQYRPSTGKYKVYIIDEVHMLTSSAFNALLKTLEEPPEHIIFILATTEVQKLPATILSRCLRFDFRLVSTEEIFKLLCEIFDDINIKYDKKAVEQMAKYGEGSVRDAISIADMCMSYCDGFITLDGVLEALGASDFVTLHRLGTAILNGESGEALTVLDKLYKEGRNTIHRDLCNYFRDLIAVKNIKGYKLSSVTEEEGKLLEELSKSYENYRISRAMETITNIETNLRYSSQPRILLEATVVKACEMRLDVSPEATATRLKELEKKLEDLKQNGIAFTKREENIAENIPENNPEKPKDDNEEPAMDISKTLQKDAVAIEDSAIFEEAENEEEERAYNAWDGIVRRLNESGEQTLSMMATEITDGICLEGEILKIKTANIVTHKFFNDTKYKNILVSFTKEELGDDFSFMCEMKTEKSKGKEKSINQLQDIFAGKVKIKK